MKNKQTGQEYSTSDWVIGSLVIFFAIIGVACSIYYIINLIAQPKKYVPTSSVAIAGAGSSDDKLNDSLWLAAPDITDTVYVHSIKNGWKDSIIKKR